MKRIVVSANVAVAITGKPASVAVNYVRRVAKESMVLVAITLKPPYLLIGQMSIAETLGLEL